MWLEFGKVVRLFVIKTNNALLWDDIDSVQSKRFVESDVDVTCVWQSCASFCQLQFLLQSVSIHHFFYSIYICNEEYKPSVGVNFLWGPPSSRKYSGTLFFVMMNQLFRLYKRGEVSGKIISYNVTFI